ncbi:MAG: haloacid dehalogenase type II [Acidobacteriia bacterium]|nr:haloacid dehalogenase type II [Terriglobia bacterium]
MSATINRRELLRAAGAVAAVFPSFTTTLRAQANARVVPKALVFDTFGTVVDWRGSIIQEGIAWGKAKGLTIDWAQFADRWRAGYAPAMEKVRKGELPWTKLDDLHRMILEELLKEFRIAGLTEEEKDHWNRVWHRLKPWPDSVAGLTRLKKKFVIAPLSNGNVALLTNMAKNAGLPWDAIMSAELARHYKPDREAYLTAVALLGLKPEETMMAAAHSGDLRAARSFGLRTGFIHRPNEYGPARQADSAKPGEFDVVARDILDLAAQLGA